MKRKALTQAMDKLEIAQAAHLAMQRSAMFEQYQVHWIAVLNATHGIYQKLAAGSRDSPKARAWFAKEKQIRKTDPLLRWVHQSRNSEEHSLGSSIEFVLGRLTIEGRKGDVFRYGVALEARFPVDIKTRSVEYDFGSIPPDRIHVIPASAKMLTVTDSRFGDSFDPPTIHLGRPIIPQTHLRVAELTLQFHADLVRRAGRDL